MRRNGSKEAKCARRGHYNETPGSELTIGTTPATDSTTTHSHSQHHKHHLSHLLDAQSDVLILNITSFGCEYFAAITQEVSLHKLINDMKKILILLVLAATMCSCRDAASSKRKLQRRIIDEIALTEAYLDYYSEYHIQHVDAHSKMKCDSLNNRLHTLYTRFHATMKD